MWGALIIFEIIFVIVFVINCVLIPMIVSVITPVIIFVMIFVIILVIIPVIIFAIIFVQGELEVTTEAGTGKAKKPNAAGQVTNVVDRVPFLFLGLDLPAAPLYKDVMETNIIPQVGDATAVDLSVCICIYLNIVIQHHCISYCMLIICAPESLTKCRAYTLCNDTGLHELFWTQGGQAEIAAHSSQIRGLLHTLYVQRPNHHPMFRTCDVHCIKVCCSVTTQDAACNTAWLHVEMQCTFIVSHLSPDVVLVDVD